MLIQILILIAGLALIVVGADILVDGSSSIAKRAGISDFVIGLTIVGMGTSAPEMVVSMIGAIKGSADVSIGNVIGSNIFNTLLIAGLTALILPMAITKENKRQDIPFNILVVVLLIILGMNGTLFGAGSDTLSRMDGIILLLIFAMFMYFSFRNGKESTEDVGDPKFGTGVSVLMIMGGLAGLILGGNLFVNSATDIAHRLNISEKFIALTILAGGTSLPELATCVVAAAKKNPSLALGNVIGSNLFNILLILGGSAVIRPLSFASINYVDLGVLLLSSLLLLLSAWTGRNNKVDRFDGALFLLFFAGYFTYLFMNI